ncbi:hypothetical protein YTPLAS18_38260 [Nitrospira sp.]|nr:hypothetical protein YTPLAS18_38260 [Nitrospira sp.]
MCQPNRLVEVVITGLCLTILIACDSGSSPKDLADETSASQGNSSIMSKEGVAPVTEAGLLVAPATSLGRRTNDEGVQHGQQGHWDTAEQSFRKAIETDDNLAEAYFNLGIALDKQGKHEEAVKLYKKAASLAPTNKLITESEVVKKSKHG